MVGATGFEPATSWSQTKCSTRLSYAPIPKRVNIDALSVPRNDYLIISPCKGVTKGSPTPFNYRPIAAFPGTLSAWVASCAWNKRKVRIALRLRQETTMTLMWVAEQLAMGTWANVARRLYEAKP